MKYALLIVDPDIRINQQVALGLSKELQQHEEWTVLVESRHRTRAQMAERIRMIQPDAVVVREPSRTWGEDLLKLPVPLVAIAGMGAFRGRAPCVSPDDRAIGAMAAEFMLAHRFDHYAVVCYEAPRPRIDVFSDAMAAAGKQLDTFHLPDDTPMDHPFREYGPPAPLANWLEGLPKPCAVFAHSDQPGAHLIRTCIRNKIRVPEEISVLGVDDDPLFCHTVMPNLASVHVPNTRIGIEAARLVLDWRPGAREIGVPPTTVVERGSCRPPRRGDPLVDLALEHLRAEVASGVRVRDLQKLTGLSSHQLVYRCHHATGRTPMDLILRQRIAVAKQLLAETGDPVADIARRSGFGSPNRFYVTFRDQVGMSPLDYRAQFAT